jgi:hypothetical protein
MQKFNQSTWNHENLYADRSSEYEQLSTRPLLREKQIENTGGWNLKFTFYFMETILEPLHVAKWSFVQIKVMDIYLQV